MFELTDEEVESLLSQNVIPSRQSLGVAKPLAFTEQGIAMLSSVLTSDRALEVNIAIMRTFVRLRQLLAYPRGTGPPPGSIGMAGDERDGTVRYLFENIQRLIEAPEPETKRRIGFRTSAK